MAVKVDFSGLFEKLFIILPDFVPFVLNRIYRII